MPNTLDDLDVIEKDTLKYDRVEMRQKDAPELVEHEAKESGPVKMEETRRYALLCLFLCTRIFCMVNVTRQFVVVSPKCIVNTATYIV